MSTLQLVEDHSSKNRDITLRIKERMGRGDLTKTNLADMTGLSRPTISRRLSGGVWQLDELELVAEALRIRWNWLVTGEGNAENPHPDGPGGGDSVRHRGLEPRTHWFREPPRSEDLWGQVVPLFAPQGDDLAVAA